MSDYLTPIVEGFDPMEYISPSSEELEEVVSDDPSAQEIEEAHKSYGTPKERGGAMLTSYILGELHDLSTQARESIEDVAGTYHREWSRDQKDDIHLFFAFLGQVQEHLLRDAVIIHVISDEATTESMKKKVMSDDHGRAMSAGECLDYLHAGGVIDSGLKGEIGQTRNERNEAVHDITRWFFAQPDPDDLEAQVSRGERSVVRLLELVYGFDLE